MARKDEIMGFWRNLFGGKEELTPGQINEKTDKFLLEVEEKIFSNPDGAGRFIRKRSREIQDAIKLGGSRHDDFQRLVFSLWDRNNTDETPSVLPTVRIIPWDKTPMMADLIKEAGETDEEILYMKSGNPRDDADALCQLEALAEFARDSKLVMMILGELTMLFRKEFILQEGRSLNPQCEEICQDLEDLARNKGYNMKFIVI
ncbi:MAG: hypothetical protein K8T10_19120 [Candidatus Eremiobacteraeota bacterium]|nr:hypothetical protein [Candidatus Eremiobacteraeota bacterium]